MQPTQNTVLITGGTSGIGLALAGRFAHFVHDRYEMQLGRSKTLLLLQRAAPALADRIMRPGL